VAVAVHAPIGLRVVLSEMTGWRGRSLDACMLVAGLLLAAFGIRAAWAVFA
jgi:fumarate reductase subunit C